MLCTQNYIVPSKDWEKTCNSGFAPLGLLGASNTSTQAFGSGILAIFFLFGLFVLSKVIRRRRASKAEGRLRLPGNEVSEKSIPDYGSFSEPRERGNRYDIGDEHTAREHAFTSVCYRSDQPLPYIISS